MIQKIVEIAGWTGFTPGITNRLLNEVALKKEVRIANEKNTEPLREFPV